MNITLNQTSVGCPEQYDAVDEHGNVVAWLSLRHGWFTAEAWGQGPTRKVYEAATIGDGVFDPDERDLHLGSAIQAIRAHLDPGYAGSAEGVRHRVEQALRAAAFSDWDVGEGLMIEVPLSTAVDAVMGALRPRNNELASVDLAGSPKGDLR